MASAKKPILRTSLCFAIRASVRQSQSCDAFLDGRVDGVLFHAHTEDNVRSARIASAGMPIVLLTRSINVPAGCAAVYIDESEVVELALNHLWDRGHRRIAHLAGPVAPQGHGFRGDIDDIAIERLDYYCSWMERRGLVKPSMCNLCRPGRETTSGL